MGGVLVVLDMFSGEVRAEYVLEGCVWAVDLLAGDLLMGDLWEEDFTLGLSVGDLVA